MIKDRNIDPDAQINPAKIAGGGGLFFLAGAARPGSDIQGNVFYVNGEAGSDSNDGLAPDRAYKTIEKARSVSAGRINWSGTPWANGDEIIVWPGTYDETFTGGLYGMTLTGLGWHHDLNGQNGVLIQADDGITWDTTSHINSIIQNIGFQAPSDSGTEAIFQADNFNRMLVRDCTFQGVPGASPTTTRGFEVVKDMTGSVLKRCIFKQIRNGIYLVADNANSKQITGDGFEDLVILGGDQTGIFFHVNSTNTLCWIKNCQIGGGGSTLALGLDDNSGNCDVAWTTFEATACDPASGDGDSHYNGCYLNGTLMT